MLYNILIPLFAFFMLLRVFSNYARGNRTGRELLFWLLFWGGFGFLGSQPDLLSAIARQVGFETGANALFVFAFLVLFYGFGRLMMIVEDMESKLTQLVRLEALRPLLEKRNQE